MHAMLRAPGVGADEGAAAGLGRLPVVTAAEFGRDGQLRTAPDCMAPHKCSLRRGSSTGRVSANQNCAFANCGSRVCERITLYK